MPFPFQYHRTRQPQSGAIRLEPLYQSLGLIPFIPASGLTPISGAGLKTGAQGVGFNASASGQYWVAGQANIISGSDTWTIIAGIQTTQTPVSGGYSIYSERPNSTQIVKLVAGDSGDSASLVVRNSSGSIIQLIGTINVRDGNPHVIVGVRNGPSDHKLYVDGVLDASTTTTIANSFGASSAAIIANDLQTLSTSFFGGVISVIHVSRQAIAPSVARLLINSNLWQLFQGQPRRLWADSAGGTGSTGTSATADAADTSSAVGTTTVTGSLAKTDANDTATATGTSTIIAASTTTDANDTATASGATGSGITGALSTIDANDTAAASATTTIRAASATMDADDTPSASGTTTIKGTSSTTDANDSCVASSTLPPSVGFTTVMRQSIINTEVTALLDRIAAQSMLHDTLNQSSIMRLSQINASATMRADAINTTVGLL